MGGVAESSRLLAALSTGENDSSNILDASRALAAAIAALLGAAKPEGQVGNILGIMEYDSTPNVGMASTKNMYERTCSELCCRCSLWLI